MNRERRIGEQRGEIGNTEEERERRKIREKQGKNTYIVGEERLIGGRKYKGRESIEKNREGDRENRERYRKISKGKELRFSVKFHPK